MTGVWRGDIDNRGQLARPRDDHAIAALAGDQHGVVSRAQLLAYGLHRSAIDRRVGAGRLHIVHRGVYAVGHPRLSREGRFMAAVLACGPGAALSHDSAAVVWEIRFTGARSIHVSVPSPGGLRRPGITIHRSSLLQTTIHRGIPVTTPARTLLDLAATLPPRRLHRALDQAEIQKLTDYPTLDALARAHAGHHGAGHLRRALASHHAGTTLTRSDLEDRFLDLCTTHGLPTPRVNTSAPPSSRRRRSGGG